MALFSSIVGAVTGIATGIRAVRKAIRRARGGGGDKPVVRVPQSSMPSISAIAPMPRAPAPMHQMVGPGGLPSIQSGGMPMPTKQVVPTMWWQGPGGKLQAPWRDPRIPQYLRQFALDDAYLKTYYRAPKGYVVIRDDQGRPFAVNKAIARQFGIWKPHKKPPISISDWQAYQKSQRVERKLMKIAGPALRKRRSRSGGVATATATARARRAK